MNLKFQDIVFLLKPVANSKKPWPFNKLVFMLRLNARLWRRWVLFVEVVQERDCEERAKKNVGKLCLGCMTHSKSSITRTWKHDTFDFSFLIYL